MRRSVVDHEGRTPHSLNERFSLLADKVSETIGNWWVTALAIVALFVWIGLGPSMHFSDTWQLVANTPTTWIELFIGFLCAAAANRLEKRSHAQISHIEALEQQNQALAEQEAQMVKHVDSIVQGMNRLLQTDHEEHGRILREIHEKMGDLSSHVTCQGHTVIGGQGSKPTSTKKRATTAG